MSVRRYFSGGSAKCLLLPEILINWRRASYARFIYHQFFTNTIVVKLIYGSFAIKISQEFSFLDRPSITRNGARVNGALFFEGVTDFCVQYRKDQYCHFLSKNDALRH